MGEEKVSKNIDSNLSCYCEKHIIYCTTYPFFHALNELYPEKKILGIQIRE